MNAAIAEAKIAAKKGEIPVGAVTVKNGEIIACAHNMREHKKSTLSHAECEAIAAANEKTGDWRLDGCTLYVTLEPCLMCMGAIIAARIDEVVFGAADPESGAAESRVFAGDLPGKKPRIYGGVREKECKELLDEFFSGKRG